MDVGEAEVASLEPVGQLGVIDAQAMEQGGVEIVNVHRVVDDVVAVVVGLAVDVSALDATAGQPDREAASMVVASVVWRASGALASRSTAATAASSSTNSDATDAGSG